MYSCSTKPRMLRKISNSQAIASSQFFTNSLAVNHESQMFVVVIGNACHSIEFGFRNNRDAVRKNLQPLKSMVKQFLSQHFASATLS